MTDHLIKDALVGIGTTAGANIGSALGSNIGLLATGGNPIGMYYGGVGGAVVGGRLGGLAGEGLHKLGHKIHVSSEEKVRRAIHKNTMMRRTRRYK